MLLQSEENEANESFPVYFYRSMRFLSHADGCWDVDVFRRTCVYWWSVWFMRFGLFLLDIPAFDRRLSRLNWEFTRPELFAEEWENCKVDETAFATASTIAFCKCGGVLRSTPSVARTALSSSASTVDESYPQDRTKTPRENTAVEEEEEEERKNYSWEKPLLCCCGCLSFFRFCSSVDR